MVMRTLLYSGCLVFACQVNAGDRNPFIPPPEKNTVIQQQETGLSEARISALISERIELILRERQAQHPGNNIPSPSSSNTVRQSDVLSNMQYIGEINNNYVYKDNTEGCYVYENVETGQVARDWCYNAVSSRLRIDPEPSKQDQREARGTRSN